MWTVTMVELFASPYIDALAGASQLQSCEERLRLRGEDFEIARYQHGCIAELIVIPRRLA
jgi:hypothetical protein